MGIRHIHRATLQKWLTEGAANAGEELALVDIRSESAFAKGHPFFATNVPLARLEKEVLSFLPRKTVRTVLVDDGGSDAAEAAAILERLGYTDINILEGGVPGWIAGGENGLPTFDIPGIIFSQSIQDTRGTPAISATELNELYKAGANVIVLDTRTVEEFEKYHVPGARSLPGAEIIHRFLDYVPSAETFVVVSCAGLPRAIIGAQSLIDAGVPNRVAFLEDGTTGWTRAGLELESGLLDRFDAPSEKAAAFGASHVQALTDRVNIDKISRDELAGWLTDETRTTYVLDVRLAPEFGKRHFPGSVSAPGGQLLAVSHRSVAVRGARLVLVSDNDTIATTTAYWLKQRGWDVSILPDALPKEAAPPRETVRGLEPAHG